MYLNAIKVGIISFQSGQTSNNSQPLTMYVFMLSVLLAFHLDGTFAAVPRGKSAELAVCEPIDVPFCKSLPYMTTAQANQEARAQLANLSSLARFSDVAAMSCSKDLAFIVCLYHLPICLPDVVMKPCRGFCNKVQGNCKSQIAALNASWLLNVNCRNLPQFHTDACINSGLTAGDNLTTPQPTAAKPTTSPVPAKLSKCHKRKETDRHPFLEGAMCNPDGSFVSKQCLTPPFGCYCVDSNGDETSRPRRLNSVKLSCPSCTCAKKRSQLDYSAYSEGNFDFAIKATILSKRKRNNGSVTIIFVKVSKIWRSGKVTIAEGNNAILRYNATCLCPALELSKEYIICGFEDTKRGRLLVTQDGAVENFRAKFLSRISKWEKRIQNTKRRMMRGISKKKRTQ